MSTMSIIKVLGMDICEDWSDCPEEQNSTQIAKWWECPRCHHDAIIYFNSSPPWPPLNLPCPHCQKESTIPWPSPRMQSWTCRRCGLDQMASCRSLQSPENGYTLMHGAYYIGDRTLGCKRCGKLCFEPNTPSQSGLASEIGDVIAAPLYVAAEVLDAGHEIMQGIFDVLRKSVGGKTYAEIIERDPVRRVAENAERAFNDFLSKCPRIKVELDRLKREAELKAEQKAEILRQKREEEHRKREEELRTLRKEARKIMGLKKMAPHDFELAVGSLYLSLGYHVFVTPGSGDQGIDLVVTKDECKIAIQCKRYSHTVPISQVRDFYGSFVGCFNQGVFITSSEFSKSTHDWTDSRSDLVLIDGRELTKMFIQNDPKIVKKYELWTD